MKGKEKCKGLCNTDMSGCNHLKKILSLNCCLFNIQEQKMSVFGFFFLKLHDFIESWHWVIKLFRDFLDYARDFQLFHADIY